MQALITPQMMAIRQQVLLRQLAQAGRDPAGHTAAADLGAARSRAVDEQQQQEEQEAEEQEAEQQEAEEQALEEAEWAEAWEEALLDGAFIDHRQATIAAAAARKAGDTSSGGRDSGAGARLARAVANAGGERKHSLRLALRTGVGSGRVPGGGPGR